MSRLISDVPKHCGSKDLQLKHRRKFTRSPLRIGPQRYSECMTISCMLVLTVSLLIGLLFCLEVQKFGNKIDKYIKQQTEKERAVYQKMF